VFQIVFICSGNICRSPMAEALLRHLWPPEQLPRVAIRSAGTLGIFGVPADPLAIEALREWGISLSEHHSQGLRDTLVSQTDLFLVMEAEHRQWMRDIFPEHASRVYLLTGYGRPNSEPAGGDDIIDPAGLDQAAFVEVRNRIRGEIDRILPILLAAANEQDELEKRS